MPLEEGGKSLFGAVDFVFIFRRNKIETPKRNKIEKKNRFERFCDQCSWRSFEFPESQFGFEVERRERHEGEGEKRLSRSRPPKKLLLLMCRRVGKLICINNFRRHKAEFFRGFLGSTYCNCRGRLACRALVDDFGWDWRTFSCHSRPCSSPLCIDSHCSFQIFLFPFDKRHTVRAQSSPTLSRSTHWTAFLKPFGTFLTLTRFASFHVFFCLQNFLFLVFRLCHSFRRFIDGNIFSQLSSWTNSSRESNMCARRSYSLFDLWIKPLNIWITFTVRKGASHFFYSLLFRFHRTWCNDESTATDRSTFLLFSFCLADFVLFLLYGLLWLLQVLRNISPIPKRRWWNKVLRRDSMLAVKTFSNRFGEPRKYEKKSQKGINRNAVKGFWFDLPHDWAIDGNRSHSAATCQRVR